MNNPTNTQEDYSWFDTTQFEPEQPIKTITDSEWNHLSYSNRGHEYPETADVIPGTSYRKDEEWDLQSMLEEETEDCYETKPLLNNNVTPTEFSNAIITKSKVGRPKTHPSNADKQKAYRLRKKTKQE